uniref:Uncharacterized protein n=1 Tax=Anguilla anguilla TaxID=7936 RepID=A0A0E9XAQ8_ANGAN
MNHTDIYIFIYILMCTACLGLVCVSCLFHEPSLKQNAEHSRFSYKARLNA